MIPCKKCKHGNPLSVERCMHCGSPLFFTGRRRLTDLTVAIYKDGLLVEVVVEPEEKKIKFREFT